MLLSPEPVPLPRQAVAAPTAQAHHFLNTPCTSHDYLQPVTVKARVIELHNKLIEGEFASAAAADIAFTEI